MEKGKKQLTIVVPVYNVERYLGQCLDSLLRQTCTDFQVVVVDDGSKDKGGDIAKSFVARYPQMFRYVYQENAGLGAARNTGLKHVTTPYVGFLDSDDWLMPRTVERVEAAIAKAELPADIYFMTPAVYDMATGGFSDWTDNERVKELFSEMPDCCPQNVPAMYAFEASVCRSIWRMDFLRENDFSFPEGVHWEDVFPHFFLFHHAEHCAMIPDAGFCYRINSGNQITSLSGMARMDVINVFRRTLQYAIESGWQEEEGAYVVDGMMNFLRWAIDVSKPEVLKKLIPQAHKLCCEIPSHYVKAYHKYIHTTRDMPFMLLVLRMPFGYGIFSNFRLVEAGKRFYLHYIKREGAGQ